MIDIQSTSSYAEIKQIWEQLVSQPDSIFDIPDVRYCFFDPKTEDIYAIVAFDSKEAVAILVLQKNKTSREVTFFGGSITEHNRVYTKKGYEYLSAELIEYSHRILPIDTLLWMDADPSLSDNLTFADDTFILSTQKYTNVDDYLNTALSSHQRSGIKRKYNLAKNALITAHTGTITDLHNLFEFNKKRFGESSTFTDQQRCDSLIRLARRFQSSTFISTYTASENVVAVSLDIKHGDIWTNINAGIDFTFHQHISTFVHVHTIHQAIMHTARKIEMLGGDCGWKSNWGFQKIPQYTYQKTA